MHNIEDGLLGGKYLFITSKSQNIKFFRYDRALSKKEDFKKLPVQDGSLYMVKNIPLTTPALRLILPKAQGKPSTPCHVGRARLRYIQMSSSVPGFP